jgi:hypothetical protein
MNRIERSFARLVGQPCWGVSHGFGSFLTFEFGVPRLVVREPLSLASNESPRVKRVLARRSVHVHGDWHLWIYCCEWRVLHQGRVVGDWTASPRRIDRAARELNGQKLVDVRLNPRGARTRFVFDLGAELETKPYDRISEQWLLYEPNGHVLSWRADRMYKYGPGNRPNEQLKWRRLPP